MKLLEDARDAVQGVVDTARREFEETVEEFYPEPEYGTGEVFGRKLGLWLTVGTVLLGVGAAMFIVFTED